MIIYCLFIVCLLFVYCLFIVFNIFGIGLFTIIFTQKKQILIYFIKNE
ncbi:putative membrane protein [Morganella morganii]|nr:putative membrane protein [Morganella morganii]